MFFDDEGSAGEGNPFFEAQHGGHGKSKTYLQRYFILRLLVLPNLSLFLLQERFSKILTKSGPSP